ncbi:MAG: excinuclease ABC subunit UvrA [Bacteroidales bacterium]|nr:excinuclease ABC subunit UvrA [Bacteroidales bacterium]
MANSENNIFIKGARVNNLKNIDVEIPRNKLIVITGLSGSGKSSLAFDTLYAEGQRRYVESLSSYARQFLGRMSKPECDFIYGIPPAIAIEQKVSTRNPSSTVGTSTEIYDYLRMFFARIGKTYSPISGNIVKKHSIEDVISKVLSYPQGTKYMVLIAVVLPEGRNIHSHLDMLLKSGFVRAEYKNKVVKIEELLKEDEPIEVNSLFIIIDRMSVSESKDSISRLSDTIETAFYEGDNSLILKFFTDKGEEIFNFSKRFEADGITFSEPTDMMFSFNNPLGACPKCNGFGKVLGIDEDLVIPNKALSVYEDCVVCWKGEKMSEWKKQLIRNASLFDFPIHRPYYQLTDEQKEVLWNGNKYFEGINDFFKMVSENQYKIQFRVMLARYRGKTLCPLCKGARLKKEALYVKVQGKTIADLVTMPVVELKDFFDNIQLTTEEAILSKRLLPEIISRLSFLINVGLGYLTLNRHSNSLSGGESQRINLATSLGSSLVGSLYILDEPSIGLHSRDTELLINVLRQLQALGNTVVVVEHDEEIIRAADYIIDIGPDAGTHGGEVVYQGDLSSLKKASKSYTVKYLTGEEVLDVPKYPRKWNNYIEVKGAAQNNLKGIDVKFPLNVMTVVTGVSGSGKSSLIRDILFKGLSRIYEETGDAPGAFLGFEGDIKLINNIQFVDQNPIGKSSRSNPATYLKAYDEIRKLFAEQQAAKQMGFSAAYFSFNVEGGRCEVCKGEGTITVPMQFMADLVLECDACHGRQFKQEVLDIQYREKNIHDVLNMTIDEAIDFFNETPHSTEKKIVKRLKPLQDVGLGYIKLGQSSSTLSGGESQRVKLAYFLSNDAQQNTMFVFDEPTTGLHFHDIKILLKAFNALIDNGHTVVIIEHNMDVIKCADYIIDLGPEGGDKGGYLVVQGTPQEVAACENSYTGKFLKEKID